MQNGYCSRVRPGLPCCSTPDSWLKAQGSAPFLRYSNADGTKRSLSLSSPVGPDQQHQCNCCLLLKQVQSNADSQQRQAADWSSRGRGE